MTDKQRTEWKLKFSSVVGRMVNLQIIPNIQATINERIPKQGDWPIYESEELESYIDQLLSGSVLDTLQVCQDKLETCFIKEPLSEMDKGHNAGIVAAKVHLASFSPEDPLYQLIKPARPQEPDK